MIHLRISSYLTSGINRSFRWRVTFDKQPIEYLINDNDYNVTFKNVAGNVKVHIGNAGVKLLDRGKYYEAPQIGINHLDGIRMPDQVIPPIDIEGLFDSETMTITLLDLPQILVDYQFDACDVITQQQDRTFPAAHFKQKVAQLMDMSNMTITDEVSANLWLDGKLEEAQDQVLTEQVELTPALAKALLERNRANRPIRPSKLRQYVSDIRENRWMFNGETIILSKDGAVNNGQHRALAVVEADKSIPILLVIGVERASRNTVDTGASRGAQDHLSVVGYTQPTTLAAATRFVIAYEKNDGISVNNSSRISSAEVFQRASSDPLLDVSSNFPYKFGSKAKRLAPPSVFAFCHYILSKDDPDKSDEYLEKVIVGAGLQTDDVAYRIREKLFELSSLLREQKIEVLLIGWVAYRDSLPLKSIRIRWEFPKL